ncbi:MAG TPA: hypothetical protein VM077_01115 [Candidatus Limnocylindrales bacterium]|nr:hypothetical protein [Candidatus Limnocylindrales bacterium]
MSDKPPFSEDYIAETNTSRGIVKSNKPAEIKIDENQYGTSKPKRIIIRASVINDKS